MIDELSLFPQCLPCLCVRQPACVISSYITSYYSDVYCPRLHLPYRHQPLAQSHAQQLFPIALSPSPSHRQDATEEAASRWTIDATLAGDIEVVDSPAEPCVGLSLYDWRKNGTLSPAKLRPEVNESSPEGTLIDLEPISKQESNN